MENAVKQAHEFGLARDGRTVAAMFGFVTEVHAMGLAVAEGLSLSEPFYWDLNDRTRAFTRRFLPKAGDNYPSSLHAGCYSAVHPLDEGGCSARAGGDALRQAGDRGDEGDADRRRLLRAGPHPRGRPLPRRPLSASGQVAC